jgi:hypothetical protein
VTVVVMMLVVVTVMVFVVVMMLVRHGAMLSESAPHPNPRAERKGQRSSG